MASKGSNGRDALVVVVAGIVLVAANMLTALLANWALEVDLNPMRVGLFLTFLETMIAFAAEVWNAS